MTAPSRKPAAALHATVLGSSCAIPRPARACSSYLLEGEGIRIILDFGTGAFANAQRYVRPEDIDAIVISHMHADHFLDLIPLRYALKYGPRANDWRVPLYLPPGGEPILRAISDALSREPGGDFIGEVFEVHTYDPARRLRIGPAQLRFAHARHYIPAFACRCELAGASFVYSADTAPADAVVRLAREADLFLCEATLLEDHRESATGRGHASAREAASMAREAGVRRLSITHYPNEATPEAITEHVRAVFAGELDVADDHATYAIE